MPQLLQWPSAVQDCSGTLSACAGMPDYNTIILEHSRFVCYTTGTQPDFEPMTGLLGNHYIHMPHMSPSTSGLTQSAAEAADCLSYYRHQHGWVLHNPPTYQHSRAGMLSEVGVPDSSTTSCLIAYRHTVGNCIPCSSQPQAAFTAHCSSRWRVSHSTTGSWNMMNTSTVVKKVSCTDRQQQHHSAAAAQ